MKVATDPTEKMLIRYRAARNVALVASVFLLLIAAFLLADFYHLKVVDPLETPALVELRAQLARDPGSQLLREQIRELDLLARGAFFARQWQLQTGAYLLLGFGAILVGSLQVMGSMMRRLPDPKRCPGLDNEWTAKRTARQVIAASGIVLVITGAILAVSIRNEWDRSVASATRQSADTVGVRGQSEGRLATTVAEAVIETGFSEEALQNWPAFRGVDGCGKAVNVDPPTEWDVNTGKNVLWKTEVPLPGFNSPVVWDNSIFLTGATAEKQEVFCFDTATGALRWRSELQDIAGTPTEPPEVMSDTGYAAPSAVTDGERVFAIFANGNIAGFDLQGKQLWGRNLGVPQNHYGHSSSLIIYQHLLYVQYDHFGGSTLQALHVMTGETVWEKARAADISWSSPILIDSDGSMRLVLTSTPFVSLYDAGSGELIWEKDVLSGEVGPSAAFSNGRVFAAQEYARAVALQVDNGNIIWEISNVELPDAASPVATDEYLFLPSSYGTFSCLNAADGSTVWSHDFANGSYGSPILVNDLIYWLTSDGVMQIFKAAGTYEQVAQLELGESSVCTPAFVENRIYIRGKKYLFCMTEIEDE